MSFTSSFQKQYYAYISTFDGLKKDFWADPDIQCKFNSIMHPSYDCVDAIKLVHAHLFALGSKVVSFTFQRMSADVFSQTEVFYVSHRLVNSKTNATIQQLITTQDGRIVHVRVVPASTGVDDSYLLRIDSDDWIKKRTLQQRDFLRECRSEGQIRGMPIHHVRT
jgi:hypothetical protein